MKWHELLKSHKDVSGAEDFADSVALIIICALLLFVVFI
jgi:hypothetical protein